MASRKYVTVVLVRDGKHTLDAVYPMPIAKVIDGYIKEVMEEHADAYKDEHYYDSEEEKEYDFDYEASQLSKVKARKIVMKDYEFHKVIFLSKPL